MSNNVEPNLDGPASTPGAGDEELTRLAASVIDVFEDYLEEKGVEIKNDDREEFDAEEEAEAAIIYGADYYSMEDSLKAIISRGGDATEMLALFEEFLREHGHGLPEDDRETLTRRAQGLLRREDGSATDE